MPVPEVISFPTQYQDKKPVRLLVFANPSSPRLHTAKSVHKHVLTQVVSAVGKNQVICHESNIEILF